MIFDSHAHYDDKAFSDDREQLLNSMQSAGITRIINVCSDMKSIETTPALAKQYDYIYAAIGIHPSDCAELNEQKMEIIKNACFDKKVVAVGEIGLDYHWPEPSADIQKVWFERQLLLSKEVNLPVIIHSREAAKDTLDIMKEVHAGSTGGVIHCYSYSKETAREFLNMGYYIGVGGVVTFSNSKKLKEVVEYVPLDRLLLETDCPYMAPVPNRGKRNSSLNLPYVVEAIAMIKGIKTEEVEAQTYQNAERLFHMEGK